MGKRAAKLIEDVVELVPIRRASLAEAYPEIAIEWYYPKNCGFGPEDFNYSSKTKVYWRCSKNKKHIYAATISNRTNKGYSGCKICNVGISTDLRDYPEALQQFDSKKNKGIDPHKLPWHAKVHWKCPIAKDHVWVSTFNRRRGERCPFCRKKRLSKTNSLATRPEVAKYLHPTKNGNKTAKDFRVSEPTVVWWKCKKGPDHEWQAKISTKTGGYLGCPFCISHKVSVTNCLATKFPAIAKEWHKTKNKKVTPRQVHAGTAIRYWWKCKKGHEWLQAVNIRTGRGSNCPDCNGTRKRSSI